MLATRLHRLHIDPRFERGAHCEDLWLEGRDDLLHALLTSEGHEIYTYLYDSPVFAGPGRALKLPPGTSVVNPIDAPVATLQEDEGRVANRIFDTVYERASPDAVVMHVNLAAFVGRGGADPIDNLIQAAVRVQSTHPGRAHFAVVLRVDGSPELDERRRRLLPVGVDVEDAEGFGFGPQLV